MVECPVCDRKFLTQAGLDQHSDVKHRDKKCPECDREFSSGTAMDQHYDAKHRFECPECDDEFTTQAAMSQHYSTSHSMVECPKCDLEFKTKNAMEQHHNAEHVFKCSECDIVFDTQAGMNQHYNAKHVFKCAICSKYFTTERVMIQHREASHRFCCAYCPDTFVIESERSQHYKTKHNLPCPARHSHSPTRVPNVQTQTPVQEPRIHTPPPPPLDTTICEHCLASFPSLGALTHHKIASHGWKCLKCPALPPFVNGSAWQAHFDAVHAAVVQPGTVTEPKEKTVPPEVDEQTQPSESSHSGNINGQHHDTRHHINQENVATQLKPPPSSLANVNQSVISSPPPEAEASGATKDRPVPSASDDNLFASKATSDLEEQTVRADEHYFSFQGPPLGALVEIEPELHQGQHETTYEIASDSLSPTMSVSSIDSGDPEEECSVSSSHSLELLSGTSLKKGRHIITPPRGPKLGDRESRAMRDPIVAGNHSRHDPGIQAQDEPRWVTPSTVKEQYGVVGPDSPSSTTSSTQDRGRDSLQGDLPHDLLGTGRSKTGPVKATPEIHFECRICLSNPTLASSLTATYCGHLFCYECIAAEILRVSRCPVCKNVLALYCLVKLDMVSRR